MAARAWVLAVVALAASCEDAPKTTVAAEASVAVKPLRELVIGKWVVLRNDGHPPRRCFVGNRIA